MILSTHPSLTSDRQVGWISSLFVVVVRFMFVFSSKLVVGKKKKRKIKGGGGGGGPSTIHIQPIQQKRFLFLSISFSIFLLAWYIFDDDGDDRFYVALFFF